MALPDEDDQKNEGRQGWAADDSDSGSDLMDFGGLLASAQEAMSAQAETSQRTVEGTSGGGVVRVAMTGGGKVTEVILDPDVVDPDDVEMLQDLIVAALSDATTKATEMQREALGVFGQLDLGGLEGGLSGLFGGASDLSDPIDPADPDASPGPPDRAGR